MDVILNFFYTQVKTQIQICGVFSPCLCKCTHLAMVFYTSRSEAPAFEQFWPLANRSEKAI